MDPFIKRVGFVVCSLFLVSSVINACGGRGPAGGPSAAALGQSAGPGATESATVELIAEIEATPPPQGVKAEIWGKLTAELARVLAGRGLDKVTSAPPSGDRNRVGDLHIEEGGGGEFLLVWSYVSAGDYDQNSEVSVSDLTPVGVHFGAVAGDVDWGAAQIADGDRNGQVGVSDITPIGQNFMARTAHYNVYASDSQADYPAEHDAANGAGTRLLGEVDFATAVVGTGGRAGFSYMVETPADGDNYWVRPNDGDSDGSPSNMTTVSGRGDWWMTGREPTLNGRSLMFGPRSGNVLWTYATGDAILSSPAVAADGRLYFGSDDDSLHAVSAAGDPLWTYPTGGDVTATPAISADGLVYFGSWDGHFYSLNSDGSLNWDFAPGTDPFFGAAIGPDGVIYVGSNDHNLYALNPDMSVAWSYPTGDAIHGCPALGPDGAVYVGSFDGSVYAINGDGSERWTFTTGDQVRGGVALAPDGTVYACSMDRNLYAIAPDGNERWRYNTDAPLYVGPAIGADGGVYLGASGAYLIKLDRNGSLLWRHHCIWGVCSRPAIGADGLVYVGDEYGAVIAVSQDGTRHWRYDTGDEIGLGLALGNDGTLYAGSADGNMYAFGGGADGTPATIGEIGPVEGITGTELTLVAPPEGTPPFTFSWDLGGSAAPDPAEGANPVVTLGAPGIYHASVTVSNAFDPPDTQEFDIYVHDAPASGGDWIHSWGGSNEEGLTDLAVDSHGHIHAVGYVYSFGGGSADVLLLEYDADGTLLSARTWGGPGWDEGIAIFIDDADNIYIAGTCTPEEGDDTALLRLNADGELSWARSWANTHTDNGGAVVVADDGTIYLAGSTTGAHPTGEYGGLLLTYSSGGELSGTLTWDTEFHERFTDLVIDGAGNIVAAGELYDDDAGLGDAVLMQLDSTMVINWVRRFASEDDVFYCHLALDADDNIYVSCAAPPLLKYDTDGNLLWARYWTDEIRMTVGNLAVSGSRLVAVGGFFDSVNDNYNSIVLSGGTDGSVDWARTLLSAWDDDIIWGVTLPTANTAYMSGAGWSNLGTWEDVPVASSAADGVSEVPTGVLGAPAGTSNDITDLWELVDAVGTEDAATGEENGTTYRLGLD